MAYAAGETILVVIGILIALQINTWNNNRLDNIKRDQYLQNLKENLTTDLANLNDQIISGNDLILKVDTLVKMVIQPEKYTFQQFKNRTQNLKQFPRFVALMATYDNLNSSGQIEILKNSRLIQDLFIYYNAVDYYNIGYGALVQDISRNRIGPYLDQMESFITSSNLTNEERQILEERLPDSPPKPFADYVIDPELSNLITSKRRILMEQINDLKALLQQVEKLLNQIEVLLK